MALRSDTKIQLREHHDTSIPCKKTISYISALYCRSSAVLVRDVMSKQPIKTLTISEIKKYLKKYKKIFNNNPTSKKILKIILSDKNILSRIVLVSKTNPHNTILLFKDNILHMRVISSQYLGILSTKDNPRETWEIFLKILNEGDKIYFKM